MGAAWREPKDRDLDKVCDMVAGVKALGLETCATLGMLSRDAGAAAESRRASTTTTTTSTPRPSTTARSSPRGPTGSARYARACARGGHPRLLRRHHRDGRERRRPRGPDCDARQSARSPGKRAHQHACQGRGHAAWQARSDRSDRRSCAQLRLRASLLPKSVVRLSAGREDMSEETQALCFLAGANSIFYGPKLLTTPNPERDRDARLLDKLGMTPMT